MGDDDRGDVPGEGQQVVAQMKSGGSTLQFSPRQHSHTEPVNCTETLHEGMEQLMMEQPFLQHR